MFNYEVKERESKYKDGLVRAQKYYCDGRLMISKSFYIDSSDKVSALKYVINALNNDYLEDFFYNFKSNHDNKIYSIKTSFCDELYKDLGKMYDEYHMNDTDENDIEIIPSGFDMAIININNNENAIDVKLFDEIVFKSCECMRAYGEYNGPKL